MNSPYDPQFIDPQLQLKEMDRFVHRKSIYRAIMSECHNFQNVLVDLGCGKMPYKEFLLKNSEITGYIGLDIESALEYDKDVKPDHIWDGHKMPFENNSFSCALATEVLEHCSEPEVFLKETHRILKSDGVFFFTVPFLWNLHEVPHDEYRYTPFSLNRHLENSGFVDINIQPMGGWHTSMAQMIGLYAKRAPLLPKHQRIIQKVGLRVMKRLLKWAEQEKPKFNEGQMISGLYGTARKPNS